MNSPSRPEFSPPVTLPANHGISLLEEVMADYVEKLEKGLAPDANAYLRAYPQLADDLKSFFRNHHWLQAESGDDGNASLQLGSSLIGTRVGAYLIESEIARGGMGIVYRAKQDKLDRAVALKLISSGILASDEERRRFRIEAEAAARLNHPGIIAIYDIGSWGGYEYFSMTLVEGPTLQKRVEQASQDDTSTAKLVCDIARAVAYAHRAGIVHRDLKPENILLTQDGRPLVVDFGLAKWHRDGTMLTRTGQVLGTPHYMSPEQAAGHREVTGTADVYSLGAILYALITGRPPHNGSSVSEVIRSVLHDEPLSPRLIRRTIPSDLATICMKAMQHDASERYETADALADDLERFLRGEPIAAAQSGILDRVAREIRRDQHQENFTAWGKTLASIGGMIFAAHLLIFVLEQSQFPSLSAYWLPRSLMLVAIFIAIYRARRGQILPRTSADRPVWSIWIGYLATVSTMNLLVVFGGLDERMLFPIAAALSGFGFIAMSGHVWGGAAIMGLTFLVAAVLSVLWLAYASLIFGTVWLVNLVTLGWHYRSKRP